MGSRPRRGSPTVVNKRSFRVRLAKVLLRALQGALPDRLYKPLYEGAFRFYKGLLRLFYLRQVIRAWLRGDDGSFRRARAVHRVMPYSLVGALGLEATYDAATDIEEKNLTGAFVECGVAQGGCSALMAMVAARHDHGRLMWLFDSFEGLPDPTAPDYDADREWTGSHIRPLPPGSCLGTETQVDKLLFSTFGLDRPKVFLVKGWFQNTLPQHRGRIGPISLLRIDGDWYESTKCCLENLYDNLVAGGYLIVDDYGVCYGCQRAVDEFMQERTIDFEPHFDGRGGVLFRKPS